MKIDLDNLEERYGLQFEVVTWGEGFSIYKEKKTGTVYLSFDNESKIELECSYDPNNFECTLRIPKQTWENIICDTKETKIPKKKEEKYFPVMHEPGTSLKHMDKIPWGLIEQFRDRAFKNHHQTLERLAERGGLTVRELFHIFHDAPLTTMSITSLSQAKAIEFLETLIEKYDVYRGK